MFYMLLAASSAPKPAWQTLKTALSLGTSGTIYDPKAAGKATISGGDLTALADAAGNGPSLSTLSGTIAIDPTTGAMTFTGANAIWTAASALFDLSQPYTLWAVLSGVGASSYMLGISDSGSADRSLIIQSGSGVYGSDVNGGFNAGTVATDSTIRLVIVGTDHAGNQTLDVPNQARVTGGGATLAAGNNVLTLGGYFEGGASASKILAFGTIPGRLVSGGDITALQAYAATKGATVA
jgi:hypothetical protein